MPSASTSAPSMAFPAWAVRGAAAQVPIYRLTRGRSATRSGAHRCRCSPRRDGAGPAPHGASRVHPRRRDVVVIGSNAGNNEPAWSFNLKADPRRRSRSARSAARCGRGSTEGEERDARQEMTLYEGFDAYKAKAGRDDIPVFALEQR